MVTASYKRCCTDPKFMERFYEIFLASDPRIAKYFRNTDFAKQRKMLQDSLGIVLMFGFGSIGARAEVNRLAVLHDRSHVNIEPSMYSFWIDSLLKTIAEIDPQFNAEISEAWREHLVAAIKHMQGRY
jgi:hemoglobin-like flavoprotein